MGSGSITLCGGSHHPAHSGLHHGPVIIAAFRAYLRRDGGCTPLHYSSWWEEESFDPCHGTIEGSRLLLNHGADINAENNEGKTPLRVALDAGRHEMVGFLSSLGAK